MDELKEKRPMKRVSMLVDERRLAMGKADKVAKAAASSTSLDASFYNDDDEKLSRAQARRGTIAVIDTRPADLNRQNSLPANFHFDKCTATSDAPDEALQRCTAAIKSSGKTCAEKCKNAIRLLTLRGLLDEDGQGAIESSLQQAVEALVQECERQAKDYGDEIQTNERKRMSEKTRFFDMKLEAARKASQLALKNQAAETETSFKKLKEKQETIVAERGEEIEAEISELRNKLQEAILRSAQNEDALQTMCKKVRTGQAAHLAAENNRARMAAELEKVRAELADKEEDCNRIQGTLTALQEQEELDASKNSDALLTAEAEIQRLLTDNDALQQQVAELTQAAERSRKEVASLVATLEDSSANIKLPRHNGIASQIHEITSAFEQIRDQGGMMNAQPEKEVLQQQVAELTQAAEQSRKEVTSLVATLEDSSENVELPRRISIATQIQEIKSGFGGMLQKSSSQPKLGSQADGETAVLSRQLQAMKSRVSVLEKDLRSAREKLKLRMFRVQDQTSRAVQTSGDLEDEAHTSFLEAKLNEWQSAHAQVTARLHNVEVSSKQHIAHLEKCVTEAKSSAAERIAALEAQHKKNRDETEKCVTTLQAGIQAREAETKQRTEFLKQEMQERYSKDLARTSQKMVQWKAEAERAGEDLSAALEELSDSRSILDEFFATSGAGDDIISKSGNRRISKDLLKLFSGYKRSKEALQRCTNELSYATVELQKAVAERAQAHEILDRTITESNVLMNKQHLKAERQRHALVESALSSLKHLHSYIVATLGEVHGNAAMKWIPLEDDGTLPRHRWGKSLTHSVSSDSSLSRSPPAKPHRSRVANCTQASTMSMPPPIDPMHSPFAAEAAQRASPRSHAGSPPLPPLMKNAAASVEGKAHTPLNVVTPFAEGRCDGSSPIADSSERESQARKATRTYKSFREVRMMMDAGLSADER